MNPTDTDGNEHKHGRIESSLVDIKHKNDAELCFAFYLPVNENPTLADVVEAIQELDQRGLACGHRMHIHIHIHTKHISRNAVRKQNNTGRIAHPSQYQIQVQMIP